MSQRAPNIATQQGTAIIVALFVMSLVAAASVAMMVRLHIDIRRTELLLNADQAYLYAEGSIAWAREALLNNFANQKPNQIVDRTPITSKLDEMDGFRIQSTIYDAQGFFNLNNLSVNDNQKDILQLLKAVEPKLAADTASQLGNAMHDWISGATKDSASDNYYAELDPPYSVPHRFMASASELRLVQGMTAKLYAELLPYLIALPEATPVNINNADIPVLLSLSPKLTVESAKAIDLYRKQNPIGDLQKFQDFDVIKNNPLPPAKITLVSNYFLVKTSVKVGQQQTILYTLLKRSTEKSKPTVTVLWQTKGTL